MKNKNIFIAMLILVAGVTLYIQFSPSHQGTGVKNHENEKGPDQSIAENKVEIKGYEFTPNTITVKKGTIITWENFDLAPHTVTIEEGASSGPDSKLFGKGEKFTYTFNEVGTFPYYCKPHPYMKGEVVVVE